MTKGVNLPADNGANSSIITGTGIEGASEIGGGNAEISGDEAVRGNNEVYAEGSDVNEQVWKKEDGKLAVTWLSDRPYLRCFHLQVVLI